jgi:predicted naringenin-chalcone synthase
MTSYLHHLATVVPEVAYRQDVIGALMQRWVGGDRRTSRLLARIYRHSGIDKRHSVVRDFLPDADGPFLGASHGATPPGTGARNALYTAEASRLYADLAKRTVAEAPGIETADITHVITVSCTGFFAPGPDYVVLRALGLPGTTERYHVGFMGCFAAFPALRMADAFCRADPDAVVLVVCVELCTLHLQPTGDPDSLVSTSVFADGGAAALVSARRPHPDAAALAIDGFASALTPDGEEAMSWTIGDSGFDMVLSSYVPKLLEANLASATAPLFEALEVESDEIERWAIHPGGRAILDKVEAGMALDEERMAASRWVLRQFGNMSSPTVLFVLKRLLDLGVASDERVAALAFGPGLTVESGLFRGV